MKTRAEIEAAVAEAEQIRARHDGVHAIHSYVSALELCRVVEREGVWADYVDLLFDEAVAKIRFVGRHGYAPKSPVCATGSHPTYSAGLSRSPLPRSCSLANGAPLADEAVLREAC